jgi:hypothetical protein
MNVEIEFEGHYPPNIKHTRDLWMHMIEHGHLHAMREGITSGRANSECWCEESCALAARMGDVETLVFLRETCACPWDANATYNALIYGNLNALIYLIMSGDCPIDFTHRDIRDFVRRESLRMYEYGDLDLLNVRHVVELAENALTLER